MKSLASRGEGIGEPNPGWNVPTTSPCLVLQHHAEASVFGRMAAEVQGKAVCLGANLNRSASDSMKTSIPPLT